MAPRPELSAEVLRILRRGQATGFEILATLHASIEDPDHQVERQLYPTLYRLEQEGLVKVLVAGDPPSRVYIADTEGTRAAVPMSAPVLLPETQNG